MGDGEWEQYVDEASGSTYYYNARTGKSSWEVPEGFRPEGTSDASQYCKARKWHKYIDDASGAAYYYDGIEGVSCWDKPEDFISEESDEEGIEQESRDDDEKRKHQDREQQREEVAVLEEEKADGEKKAINEHTEKANEETEGLVLGDDKDQSNSKIVEEAGKDNSIAALQWVKYVDVASNKPYYFNASTGKTQWDEPDGFDESTQPAAFTASPHVSAEYQAYLNRIRTEHLARVTQQVLDPSGNLSKLNNILSGIDSSKASHAMSNVDEEIAAADTSQNATAEWQQHIDAQTKRYYYYNVVTGTAQWNDPGAPIVSGLANWIPPEVPESSSTDTAAKTVSGVNYVARAKFNRLTGKYEQLGGDDYWQNAGIASDRAGRQMSHFFDMTELEKNREEAIRRKEELKRRNIDWKKITAEKKAKKQKQKNEWLFTD